MKKWFVKVIDRSAGAYKVYAGFLDHPVNPTLKMKARYPNAVKISVKEQCKDLEAIHQPVRLVGIHENY